MKSRRDFLKHITAAALIARSAPMALALPQRGQPTVDISGEDGMIVRSLRFVDMETPVEYFNSWLTPIPHFFVRNHMHEPSQISAADSNANDWRLSIGGEVEKPVTLSLADLRKIETHSVVNTLECAGNGRSLHHPRVPGVQWGKGAVGTARFSGPRLRDVLQRAGVKASGKHVMFRGMDEVPGKVPPFIRSIPIEKALDADTLIAIQMNNSPLNKHHGFPARALVPGWIGAASCKWLTEIKIMADEFSGNFMSPAYRFPNQPVQPGEAVKPEDTHSLTALTVKSLITAPADGAVIKAGKHTLKGNAWAGEADVAKVEISIDNGQTWSPATLGHERARYAWRLWSYDCNLAKRGEYAILSRATDTQGRIQPSTALWNPSGYLYNAIDTVKIHVA